MDNKVSTICRVCLDSSAVMCSLADQGTREMLFECTSVWVEPGDEYPQQICAICWNQCMTSSVFRTLARESDRQLRAGKKEEVVGEEIEIIQEEEEEPLVLEEVMDEGEMETVQEEQHELYEEEYLEVPGVEQEEEVQGEPEIDDDYPEIAENYEETTERTPLTITNAKLFKCGYCPKSFRLLPLLRQHIIAHENERSPQSEKCESAFFQVKPFTQQKLLHTEIKSFNCERCDKKFNLICHENGHRNANNFKKCERCGQEFQQESSLRVHRRTCLTWIYSCTKCGLRFKDQMFLNYHMKNHH